MTINILLFLFAIIGLISFVIWFCKPFDTDKEQLRRIKMNDNDESVDFDDELEEQKKSLIMNLKDENKKLKMINEELNRKNQILVEKIREMMNEL